MCRSAAGTWCALKVILSKVHRDLEDLPGNISPFRALVRVRDYSPVPRDVSQLKETNSNVVPSTEHRSSQGGGRTSIFITRNPSSLLLLPIFIPSFILFYLLGGLEDTCMTVSLVQAFIFKWSQFQDQKVNYSDFIEQTTLA